MTDNELKKIRQNIACPQFGDDHYGSWGALSIDQRRFIKRMVDYIEGQKAEIERLRDVVEKTDNAYYQKVDEIDRLKAEIEELETEIDKQYEQAEANILGNMADGGMSCHWCIEKHRANAIKEFAERLKNKLTSCSKTIDGKCEYLICDFEIDTLVKEMVGDNNG